MGATWAKLSPFFQFGHPPRKILDPHLMLSLMGILGGGLWVEVRFKDYSPRSTYIHIYFEFWLWGAFSMFNIYMYWERNPLRSRGAAKKKKKNPNDFFIFGLGLHQQIRSKKIYNFFITLVFHFLEKSICADHFQSNVIVFLVHFCKH